MGVASVAKTKEAKGDLIGFLRSQAQAAGRDADRLWAASVSKTDDVRGAVGGAAADVKRILQETADQGTRVLSAVSGSPYGLGEITAGIVAAGSNLLKRGSSSDISPLRPSAGGIRPAADEQGGHAAADRV